MLQSAVLEHEALRRANITSVRDAELHGVGGGQGGHTGGDGVVAHAVATGAKARATQEGQVARLGARGSAHSSPSRGPALMRLYLMLHAYVLRKHFKNAWNLVYLLRSG